MQLSAVAYENYNANFAICRDPAGAAVTKRYRANPTGAEVLVADRRD